MEKAALRGIVVAVIGVFVLAGRAPAQTESKETISPGELRNSLIEMKGKVDAMIKEIFDIDLLAELKKANAGTSYDYLSNWKGNIYLRAEEATRIHRHHRGILGDQISWLAGSPPPKLNRGYLAYYREGTSRLEAHHRKVLAGFRDWVGVYVKMIQGLESSGQEGMNSAAKAYDAKLAVPLGLQNEAFFEMVDMAKGVVPEAPILRIESVRVQNAVWHAERAGTQEELRLAKEDLKARDRELAAKLAQVSEKEKEIQETEKEVVAEIQQLARLEASLATAGANLKDASYKKAETRLAAIERRLRTIEERLPLTSGKSKGLLAEEGKALVREQKKLEASLKKLGLELGIAQARDRMQGQMEAAGLRLRDARSAKARAESEFFIALNGVDGIQRERLQAMDKVDALQAKAGKLGSETPAVTAVVAGGFRAERHDPGAFLELVARDLLASRQFAFELAAQRRDCRMYLTRLNEELISLGNEYDWAQLKSKSAQFGVEAVSFGADVWEGAKKGGLWGVLGECLKKGVENIYDPVEYYDAESLIPERERAGWVVRSLLPNEVNTAVRELADGKGFLTAVDLADLGSKKGLDAYVDVVKNAAVQSWISKRGTTEISGGGLISDFLKADGAKLAEARGEVAALATKSGFWKQIGVNMVSSVVKDAAKKALKEQAAVYFESESFQKLARAQLGYRAEVTHLLSLSNLYWKTIDAIEFWSAIQAKVLEEYDPNSGFRILSKGEASADEDLVIQLSMQGDYRNLPIEVSFGGQKAVREGGSLSFRVPAAALKGLAKKGYELQVVIKA